MNSQAILWEKKKKHTNSSKTTGVQMLTIPHQKEVSHSKAWDHLSLSHLWSTEVEQLLFLLGTGQLSMSHMNQGHQTKEIHQPLPKRKTIQLGEKKEQEKPSYFYLQWITFQFGILFMAWYNHVAEKNLHQTLLSFCPRHSAAWPFLGSLAVRWSMWLNSGQQSIWEMKYAPPSLAIHFPQNIPHSFFPIC